MRLKASACFKILCMVERVMKGVRVNIGVFSFLSCLAVMLHFYIHFVWCIIAVKYDENKNTPQQSHTCMYSEHAFSLFILIHTILTRA
jgi:hypothetical protein